MTKTTDFSTIIASVPVNGTAARVMSRGVHYERNKKPVPHKFDTRAQQNPLAVDLAKQQLHPLTPELVGKQFGRWRVIGLAARQPRCKKSPSQWVVKCSCGRYETRRSGAIERARETRDCCWECKTRDNDISRYKKFGSAPLASFTGGKV